MLKLSFTITLYWYSFIKSEFISTPVFLVTSPADVIWNGFSCGSVACDVPPYEPLETFELSNSSLCNSKLLNVIVSESTSVADIEPTVAPFELFSLIDERVWLLIVGCALSETLTDIGKVTIASLSCPAW